MSANLFRNLQTEFREANRKDAEKIQKDINQKIEEDRLERDLKQMKIREEAEARQNILAKDNELKEREARDAQFKQKLTIGQEKRRLLAQKAMADAEMDNDKTK